ncbi:MAG TPA: flagellar hook-length control protein FliK [Anaerohalosphaeraceae bacterium]|nr:flagellar hook-length control protein FliK [Anaerohalosphaeraceae bacterium]HOL89901.1 flagellar hook-length control protein FliK [Anaerohalosphaeraceae bacterium]HPP57141.1 flagellar hook-length control protein FliK [Anaerohalosphaeraceae bacterium]
MTQTAGIGNILTTTVEPSLRPVGSETALNETAAKKKNHQIQESDGNKAEFGEAETLSSPFLTVLNKKMVSGQEDQTDAKKKPSGQKQENIPATAGAEIILLSKPLDNTTTLDKILKHPKATAPKEQSSPEILPKLPTLPNLTQKNPATESTTSDRVKLTQDENPKSKSSFSSLTFQETSKTIKTEGVQIKQPFEPQITLPDKTAKTPDVIQNLPKVASQQIQFPQIPLTTTTVQRAIPLNNQEKAVSHKKPESVEPLTEPLSKPQKIKSSLKSSNSSDSSQKKDFLNPETPGPTPALIRTQSGIEQSSLHSAAPITYPAKASEAVAELAPPLSASQQVLRNIQNAVQNDIQSIQISLTPEGLGLVRIKFDKIGDEISGILEIQKEQTRQEIEKSLPNILASLENQGIQIRKIEISPIPNQEQKHTNSESTSDWNLRYEMQEERQRRTPNADSASSPEEHSNKPALTPETERSYQTHPDSKVLNLFI